MKKIFGFLCLVAIAVIFNSCSIKEDGKWDDNIKLSTKTVQFKANADSVTIKTGGSSWWVTDISVDNTFYSNFTGIDLQSYSFLVKQDCFIVERKDKNTLFIKVQENPLSVKRIITVGLEAGDYFDRVTITQAAN